MNDRDLSERLDSLATQLVDAKEDRLIILQIAEELRQLSNQKYAPGNSSTWEDLKPKTTKKIYTDKFGRKLPF